MINPEPKFDMCPKCNGSGEGYSEDSDCTRCGGSGLVPEEREENDSIPYFYDETDYVDHKL